MTDRQPSVTSIPPDGGSAVEMKRAQRRIQRYVGIGVLVLVAAPFLVFGLFAALASGMVGDGVSGVLGVAAFVVFGLILAALPVAVPVLVFGGIAYAIFKQYRRSPAPAPGASIHAGVPPAGGEKRAARVAAAGIAIEPLHADLLADLATLETLREATARRAAWRTRILVPLFAGGTALFWFVTGMGHGGEGSPTMGFLILVGMAAVVGWLVANHGPRSRYALLFKQTLMPRLLARYGDLRYTSFTVPPLDRLVAVGVLPRHDKAGGDDGIEGVYRDHRVSIGEIDLIQKGDKSDSNVFHGLLVVLETPAPLPGTTVVLDNAPLAGRLGPERRGLQRVRLEDPVFEEIYQVFGTDQIAARTVLTPAAMERLLVMADGQAFHPPFLLADASRLVFAIKRWDNKNLFEPPSLSSHDAAGQLAESERELAGVFSLIDAMIGVGGSGDAMQGSAGPPQP